VIDVLIFIPPLYYHMRELSSLFHLFHQHLPLKQVAAETLQ
jgi:hypothetical protein